MNINLKYQNNSFNFDLRKDISIKYLEDLVSKLINKDKSSFELLYENNNLADYTNSLLKDHIKTDSNVSIIISPKKTKHKLNSRMFLPKIKLFKTLNNNLENSKKKDYNLNETEISQILSDISIKDIREFSNNNFNYDKKRKKENKYITKNMVFEEIYNNKENEIFSLMKNLSQKIKEYDNVLYKIFKNNSPDNKKKKKELLLFEKNIIDFKCRQIAFIKKLINYFNITDKNEFSSGRLNLNDFYKELQNYNIKDNFLFNNKNKKIEQNLLSPSNRNEISNSNKEFPLLTNNNETKSIKKIFLSQKKLDQIINVNKNENIDKKENTLYYSEKRPNKKKTLYRNDENLEDNLFQQINTQEKNISNINDNKNIKNKNYIQKNSIGTTTNENTESSTIPDKNNNILQNLLPKKLNNENIDNNNFNVNNNNTNSIIINNNNIRKSRNSKDIQSPKGGNTIENVKSKYNNLSTLFEINESQNKTYKESECSIEKNNSLDNKDQEINKLSDDEEENNSNDIKNLKTNLGPKKKKMLNYSKIKDSKTGLLIKYNNRKIEQRIKRLGSNKYDFLI